MKLYIGNKNYSSWSMRAWVLMREFGIEFEEVMARFDGFSPESQFKRRLADVSPVGQVPVLVDADRSVWDTLAIAEYLAERFPERMMWPQHPAHRARARSICAEMHGGFSALRRAFPMNIEAHLPDVGALVLRDNPAVRADLARILQLWTELLQQHGGPLLFGQFSIADAYFAPVVMRLLTYGVPVPPDISAYMHHVTQLDSVSAWVQGALAEHDFLDFEEPYRLGRAGSDESILEIAPLEVRAGQAQAFEANFQKAQALVASMPGYLGHELQRCLERPDHYMLLIRWKSVEHHEKGFRGSPQYQEWRKLLHHFYDPFPTVLHYEKVLGPQYTERRSTKA